METTAIRECIDYLGVDVCWVAMNAKKNLDDVEQYIVGLENAIAVKDEAIFGIIEWAENKSRTLWDDEYRRLKAALSLEPTGKVLVDVDMLKEIEWVNGRCPACGRIDPRRTDCPQYRGHSNDCWLDAKIKETS